MASSINDRFLFKMLLGFLLAFISCGHCAELRCDLVELEVNLSSNTVFVGDEFFIITSFKNIGKDHLSLLGHKYGTVFDFKTLGGEELKRYLLRLPDPMPFPKESIVVLKPGEQHSFETPCKLFRVENKLRLQLDRGSVQYEVDEEGVVFIADYAVFECQQRFAKNKYGTSISYTNNLVAEVAYELGSNCLIRAKGASR